MKWHTNVIAQRISLAWQHLPHVMCSELCNKFVAKPFFICQWSRTGCDCLTYSLCKWSDVLVVYITSWFKVAWFLSQGSGAMIWGHLIRFICPHGKPKPSLLASLKVPCPCLMPLPLSCPPPSPVRSPPHLSLDD